MLILDTEVQNESEYPTAGQLLQDWVARLWAWLRWRARHKKASSWREHDVSKAEESIETQDCGTGLIL